MDCDIFRQEGAAEMAAAKCLDKPELHMKNSGTKPLGVLLECLNSGTELSE